MPPTTATDNTDGDALNVAYYPVPTQLAGSSLSDLPLGGLPGDRAHAEGDASRSAETPARPRVTDGQVRAPELLIAQTKSGQGLRACGFWGTRGSGRVRTRPRAGHRAPWSRTGGRGPALRKVSHPTRHLRKRNTVTHRQQHALLPLQFNVTSERAPQWVTLCADVGRARATTPHRYQHT